MSDKSSWDTCVRKRRFSTLSKLVAVGEAKYMNRFYNTRHLEGAHKQSDKLLKLSLIDHKTVVLEVDEYLTILNWHDLEIYTCLCQKGTFAAPLDIYLLSGDN